MLVVNYVILTPKIKVNYEIFNKLDKFLYMFKNTYHLLGVMSGTSLDGIDLAYVRFDLIDNKWQFDFLKTSTISYSHKWRALLSDAINFTENELNTLNVEYTKLLANTINDFLFQNKINELDAICSHGHTIKHLPQNGITLQIGNLQELSTLTKHTVVCDFRVQDVKLGGQGAPLVPIGDQLLFENYDYCINLGGFSNISFDCLKQRISYDICPVNVVLNTLVASIGLEYDNKGTLASKGIVNQQLLNELNSLDYYQKSFPKSLGIEWVQEHINPIFAKYNIDLNDLLRTYVEHIAIQISKQLKPNTKALFTGGGTYHDFLMQRIRDLSSKTEIIIPDDTLISYKEALIFAFLGLKKLRNEINVLSSVTGASKDHCSGVIFFS